MSAELERLTLVQSVQDFLYREAELLDGRKFSEWLATIDPRVAYRAPLRLNVEFADLERERTRPGEEICWFDDDFETLENRVDQLLTGLHWAEEPASRSTHVVSNVRLAKWKEPLVHVESVMIFYRNRVDSETDILAGRRSDVLTRESGEWKLLDRIISLDQHVLQAKNLTLPF